eukprot:5462944-Amphidinium_carterae.1
MPGGEGVSMRTSLLSCVISPLLAALERERCMAHTMLSPSHKPHKLHMQAAIPLCHPPTLPH